MFILTNYTIWITTDPNEYSTADGVVYDNPNFKDGTFIRTSNVLHHDSMCNVITTRNSKYKLIGIGTIFVDGVEQSRWEDEDAAYN